MSGVGPVVSIFEAVAANTLAKGILSEAAAGYGRSFRPRKIFLPTKHARKLIVVTKGPRKNQLWAPDEGYEFQIELLNQIFQKHRPGETRRELVFMKGCQLGATLILLMGLLIHAYVMRGSGALAMPRDPDAKLKAAELADMIDASPELARYFRKKVGQFKKTQNNEELIIVGTQTDRNLISWAANFVGQDEYDRQGELPYDVDEMLKKRMVSYTRNTILRQSTPLIPDTGVDELLQASSWQEYWVPCFHCSYSQVLTFDDNLKYKVEGRGPDQKVKADFACVKCGGAWNRTARKQMNGAGAWRARYPRREAIGFHLSRLYSPAADPVELAKNFIAGENNEEKKREHMNQDRGLGFISAGGKVDPATVRNLITAELEWGQLPSGTAKLCAGVDIQGDAPPYTFFVEVKAFSHGGFASTVYYECVRGEDACVALLKRRFGNRVIDKALLDATDGDHLIVAGSICARVAHANAVIWDNKTQASFGEANLNKDAFGIGGWRVHRERALNQWYSRLVPDEHGKFRVRIAANPNTAYEQEFVEHCGRLLRVSVNGRWHYSKSQRTECDYPFASALAEVAFKMVQRFKDTQEARQRERNKEARSAALERELQRRSQRQANLAKRRAQQRSGRGRRFT